jgi:hypothetical protein
MNRFGLFLILGLLLAGVYLSTPVSAATQIADSDHSIEDSDNWDVDEPNFDDEEWEDEDEYDVDMISL